MRCQQPRLLARCFALLSLGAACALAPLVAAEPPPPPAAAAAPNLAGSWTGTLKVGAIELRLVVHLSAADEGQYQGKMDSIDQGAKDLPIDAVTLADGKLTLELKKLNGTFTGQANEAYSQFAGTWKQNGIELPLTLSRTDAPPELRRPQTPHQPFPYRSETVTYPGGADGVTLAGTLTLPEGSGPFPAVLLITGSGPQDRDETLLGHKPFLVLADHLTRRGIAVLRVDDRGVGQSTGDFAAATTLDFAADARAGVQYLAGRAEIDSRRIGLAGHSEGALVAPLVAADNSDVAFVVLLAAPGVTGEQIMYRQGQLLLAAMGADEAAQKMQLTTQQRMFAAVKEEPDTLKLKERLQAVVDELKAELSEEERAQLDKQRAATDAQIDAVTTPWFRYFLTYDPVPTLQKLRCPVLAVVGQRDLQVEPAQNIPAIEAALKAARNPDFRVQELPGLNHLFQTCRTGSVAEYGQIEETFAPAALAAIGDWIEAHTKK